MSPPLIREKDVERYLGYRVRQLGGKAYKWVSPGANGVPDRIVLIHGYAFLVEVKRPDGRLRPNQKRRHVELTALGFPPATIYDHEQVDKFIARVKRVVGL